MKKIKKKNQKILGSIGTALLATAGAIVSLVFGGPLMALPGLVAGFAIGYAIERQILKYRNK